MQFHESKKSHRILPKANFTLIYENRSQSEKKLFSLNYFFFQKEEPTNKLRGVETVILFLYSISRKKNFSRQKSKLLYKVSIQPFFRITYFALSSISSEIKQ